MFIYIFVGFNKILKDLLELLEVIVEQKGTNVSVEGPKGEVKVTYDF